jgi:hypothetical protein
MEMKNINGLSMESMEMNKYRNRVWSANMTKESNERVTKMTKYESKGYNLRNVEDKMEVAEGWYMRRNESVGFSTWDLSCKLDNYETIV